MNTNERKLQRKADGMFRLDFGSQFCVFLSSVRQSRIQFAAISVHSRFNYIVPAKSRIHAHPRAKFLADFSVYSVCSVGPLPFSCTSCFSW
jgi:hypothetical protein